MKPYSRHVDIDWDESKNEANQTKHGFSFAQGAELLLSGHPVLEVFDDVYSGGEERFVAIGEIDVGVIAVVYADYQGDRIRIISVRQATAREARAYQRFKDEMT